MDRPTARRLPDEMVFRILSFLPEKPLSKFRCVCKLWNTLFIDPKFRALYSENYSSLPLLSYNELKQIRHNFWSKAESSDGLILEQTVPSVSPSRCRIKCPLSQQSIEFPGPQKPSLCFAVEFLPSIRSVELVSVHEDENQVLGYEVLHIGPIENITPTTKYSWRALQVPSNNQFRKRMRSMNLHYRLNSYLDRSAVRNGFLLFFRRGVAYCIWAAENNLDIHVDVLDTVNESYIGHTTLPAGTFISDQLNNIQLLDWNGKLSFAEVVNDELHILVFDYNKKQHQIKWTRRMIKLMTTLKDVTCFVVDKSALFFSNTRGPKKYDLCSIDVNTGNVTTIQSFTPELNAVWCNWFLSSRASF